MNDVSVTFDLGDGSRLKAAADHLRGIDLRDTQGEYKRTTYRMDDYEAPTSRIPPETIQELISLRAMARAAAETFSEAIKAQCEKHEVMRSALRRYICAAEADLLATLDAEAEDLARLLTREEVSP